VKPSFSDGAVSGDGCGRSQTRTWNATDACGNPAAPVSRTVTWTEDTEGPVVTCPANIVAKTCNDVITWTSTATDKCSGSVPVECTPAPGTFPVGTTTVTCTAVDACGNKGSCSFTVTVPPCAEGCTPGFWAGGVGITLWNQSNDPQWTAAGGAGANPFTQGTVFCSFFNNASCPSDLSGLTMLDLVGTGNGPTAARKAARFLVAAYLNSSFGLDFPFTPSQLKDMWAAAVAGGNSGLSALATTLSVADEAGCPIGSPRSVSSISAESPSNQGSATTELYRPRPNPFSETSRFAYAVPGASGELVDIGVFDITGRRIRSVYRGVTGPGTHEAVWDGRSDSGEKVRRGVYYVHIVIGTEPRTVRIAYLK
jgi:hypothetical protein